MTDESSGWSLVGVPRIVKMGLLGLPSRNNGACEEGKGKRQSLCEKEEAKCMD